MLVGEKGLTCVGGKLFFFFRVMLREIVGSIFLSQRVFLSLTEGISFSHRAHRFNRTHLRTVSIPQKASGIQKTQSVSAIVDTDKEQQAAYILPIGVSR